MSKRYSDTSLDSEQGVSADGSAAAPNKLGVYDRPDQRSNSTLTLVLSVLVLIILAVLAWMFFQFLF
ncbi:MAG: hypothetical protein U0401_11835 [Anaerolineae bacterium]